MAYPEFFFSLSEHAINRQKRKESDFYGIRLSNTLKECQDRHPLLSG